MPLFHEPEWWYQPARPWQARVLQPLAAVYGWAAKHRLAEPPKYRPGVPVICVGNFTTGGTGKTPVAILLARLLKTRGRNPAFLSRGYGGIENGPAWVTLGVSSAREVGDEPLLLASVAPVIVARDRVEGAKVIEAAGFDCMIMDDGMQNPDLAKDLVLAVIDARRGLGNGAVIPAGPLRAPLAFQLGLADALIVNSGATVPATQNTMQVLRREYTGPVLSAGVKTRTEDAAALAGKRFVAYAGIANPQRFFDTIRSIGAELAGAIAFADHYRFTASDASALIQLAEARCAALITTEKDYVRLEDRGAIGLLRAASQVLAIDAHMNAENTDRLEALIAAAFSRQGGPSGRLSPAAASGEAS